jgi:hypothetical protein
LGSIRPKEKIIVKNKHLVKIVLGLMLTGVSGTAQDLACDMSGYQRSDGLEAELRAGKLQVSWSGERG